MLKPRTKLIITLVTMVSIKVAMGAVPHRAPRVHQVVQDASR